MKLKAFLEVRSWRSEVLLDGAGLAAAYSILQRGRRGTTPKRPQEIGTSCRDILRHELSL